MLIVLSGRCCLIVIALNARLVPKPLLMSEIHIKRSSAVGQPFAFTGVDYFGPLLVQAVAKSHGGKFACLSQRVYTSNWQKICQLAVLF